MSFNYKSYWYQFPSSRLVIEVLYHPKNAFYYWKVELIREKRFVVIALDLDYKIFVIYITTLNISFNVSVEVHLLKRAQIVNLKIDKAFTQVFNIHRLNKVI